MIELWERQCAVAGAYILSELVASRAKPRTDSTEKLDPSNGLPLAGTWTRFTTARIKHPLATACRTAHTGKTFTVLVFVAPLFAVRSKPPGAIGPRVRPVCCRQSQRRIDSALCQL